jgi:hypothetical protein
MPPTSSDEFSNGPGRNIGHLTRTHRNDFSGDRLDDRFCGRLLFRP